jgi:hypothetical protein
MLNTKRWLHTTTAGPSHQQILIPLEAPSSANTFPTLVGTINCALGKKSSLWVQSIHHAYGGLSLLTNNIATLPELGQVADAVKTGLGQDSLVLASLPHSQSYLKVVDIPIFKPGSSEKINSAFAHKVMLESPVGHLISFASSPRIMHNTCHSDTTTMWFNVVDSQSGASAKAFINSLIQFSPASCLICGTRANPGTPLCQHCWCWGHSARTCTSRAPKCPQCSGPHSGDNHCVNCGSCKGNLNMKPRLVPPTADGLACPHLGCCVNCKGEHSANDNKCPFWRH